uniref:NADH-ubiquinone oxidoreductase chain 4L n=1 Tax=Hyphessobrycon herbertaxelrodi TaxID=681895 RepID=A0A7H1KFI0_9TELE|nr:NADH dehydrogenase subunit 4L [Hyphessobrycon herbertaxelrodi]QNT25989.1 NADH dehydrogenase subunit 4L [Hyphessobrycon herbertaxelrodi]QOW38138.1 NADH dehydrogenase subunit 4L [Hyphessobrycon herbertaxelrodi]
MSLTLFSLTSSFTIGLMGLTFHRAHLLSALLCLEGMMLSLFIAMALWVLQLESASSSAAPMLIITFSACEASVGLALLVATTRTHGTNHLQSLNLLQC